jgi:toluene monooxygenase system protein E
MVSFDNAGEGMTPGRDSGAPPAGADGAQAANAYDAVSIDLHSKQPPVATTAEGDPNADAAAWYRAYREGSQLRHSDWASFQDPGRLTNTAYNVQQDRQEAFVENLLDQMSERGSDGMLDRGWVSILERHYAPMRYPLHGLQAASAYLAMTAPSVTIANCATYQAADLFRWVNHTAYRTAELGKTFPEAGFGHKERAIWEQDSAWQGFRELVEKVLVVWDWGEAFTALNLVVKPAVEEGIMAAVADAASRHEDSALALLISSQMNDARRHRLWTHALVQYALAQHGNGAILDRWLVKWTPLARTAIDAYCEVLPEGGLLAKRASAFVTGFHTSVGLGR